MDQESNHRQIKTTETVFSIVDVLQAQSGATISVVADELGLAQSTVYNHIKTLEDQGFVIREADEYAVGLRFLDYGGYAREQLPVVQEATTVLSELAEDTGELVWLITEQNGYAIFLRKAEGDRAISVRARVGTSAHLHYLGAGKAILAAMDAEDRENILDNRGLPQATPQTITDRDILQQEIADAQRHSYATMQDEVIEGLSGAGAAIVDEGRIAGAISLAGPSHRLDEDTLEGRITEPLLGAVNEIELRLKRN